jgi:hypothetical protein
MGMSWTSNKPCPNCGKKQGSARRCTNCGTLGCIYCVSQNKGGTAQCNICKKRGGIIEP